MAQAVYTVTNPDNLPYTWALTAVGGDDDTEHFEISQLNGGLKLKEAQNYEDPEDADTSNTYTVNVGIVLTGRTPAETTPDTTRMTTVTVTVTDVAEAPEFTKNVDDNDVVMPTVLNIDENNAGALPPLNTMKNRAVTNSPQASDEDDIPETGADNMYGDVALVYTLSPDDGAFSIVPATGELRTMEVLDFERLTPDTNCPEEEPGEVGRCYMVTVTATDPTGLYDMIDLVISVNDVDEPPTAGGPNMAPEFPSATMTREIAENTAAGMAIGDPVMATDPENNNIEYTLGGPDAAHFTINMATGQLSTAGALDFEMKNSYTVTVTAMDDDEMEPMSSMTTVTITVTNADDMGTVMLSSMSPIVDVMVTATLTDPDGMTSNESWQWEKSMDGSTWMDISGATMMSYTPMTADVGYYLRAMVEYTDPQSTDMKNAMSAMTTDKVADDPNQALISRYDTNGDGLSNEEIDQAVEDYLFNGLLSNAEMDILINAYLFGS